MSRTQAQIEASRRNGANSKGPVSQEGKARSAEARLSHGLCTDRVVVLNNESVEAFDKALAEAMEEHQPETPSERRLVQDIVVSSWRLDRLLALEAACLDEATDRKRVPEGWVQKRRDEATLTHQAVASLTPNTLTWYSRHEARLRRAILNAQTQLRLSKAARKRAA